MDKKREGNSAFGKRENAHFHVETASGNRQRRKMAGKSWSRAHLNVMLNLSNDSPVTKRTVLAKHRNILYKSQ